MRTWYPGSNVRESAEALTLQPGEKREGIDVEVKKSPSYCAEGTVFGPTGAAALRFQVETLQPSSGFSSSGGIYMLAPNGVAGSDGQFRVCDLYPGVYRLSAESPDRNPQNFLYGGIDVTITDQDLQGVRVNALPARSVEGEAMWDTDPPATPVTERLRLMLVPQIRTGFLGGRSDIPGTFTIDGVFLDDYAVHIMFNAPGIYVKDVTFSGRSVMYEPLRMGSAMGGAGLRVIMAQDGATVNVQVNDKDGNPAADLHVFVLPAEVTSEAILQARLVQGQTDQTGLYTSQTLPPGKYYVVATDETVDATLESIGRLWRSRNRFHDVTLPPGGTVQVRLEPGKIE
jgi:hypothetical protein